MPDVNVERHQSVTSDGANQSGVASTVQTSTDPVTGGQVSDHVTRVWAGKAPGVELVWLIAGVVIAFLAFDFIFHAAGANDVGFASFVFSVGGFFAAPFKGIFNTSTTGPGNLVIWADVLAMVIYAFFALALAKAIALMSAPKPR